MEKESSNPEEITGLEKLKIVLGGFIKSAREENTSEKLRCRPLSEAITCAEAAYLWLNEVQGEGILDDI